MSRYFEYVRFVIIFLLPLSIYAQEGGPPMLTDDARVADYKEWELNVSVNTSKADRTTWSIPHIDLNYGVYHDLQLKIEAPLLFNFNKDIHEKPSVGEVIFGVKYRFLDEEKHYVSAATFPQYTVHGQDGFYLPLFIERTFGRFLTGVALAQFWGQQDDNHSELGILGGYIPHEQVNLMLEYYWVKPQYQDFGANGYTNVGFRWILSDHLMIMGSAGSQLKTPDYTERERFFSWLGVKLLY